MLFVKRLWHYNYNMSGGSKSPGKGYQFDETLNDMTCFMQKIWDTTQTIPD